MNLTTTRNGFSCPAFHVVKDSNDAETAIANVPTPCYVKPALDHLWSDVKRTELERAYTAAEVRRIQEICDQPEVSDLGLRLLAVSGHRGTATVEFRRDQRNGRFVLIEINPRTSLAQELITRSGLDIPLLAYADAKAMPMPPTVPVIAVRWIDFVSDFRAFRQLRRRGQITTGQWLGSIAGCRAFAYLALDDPRPFLTRSWMWLTRWRARPFQRRHEEAGREENSSLPA